MDYESWLHVGKLIQFIMKRHKKSKKVDLENLKQEYQKTAIPQ